MRASPGFMSKDGLSARGYILGATRASMTNDNTFANLIQYLSRHGVTSWSKADPAAISTPIPEVARRLFPSCAPVFARYGDVIYSAAWIPKGDIDRASLVVRTYFDLYARERGGRSELRLKRSPRRFSVRFRSTSSPR